MLVSCYSVVMDATFKMLASHLTGILNMYMYFKNSNPQLNDPHMMDVVGIVYCTQTQHA